MPGFSTQEYQARVARAQSRMEMAGLSALLLTTEPNVRYFSGFLTRFWESPTRPWYLVVPVDRPPIAVIPAIGAYLMGQGWISDIRTWIAPDYEDDGISLLADALREVVPDAGKIGLPTGLESHLRMPLDDWATLRASVENRTFCSDGGLMRNLRAVKSDAEITKISAACAVAGRAFARVPEIASVGTPLSSVFRDFQILCLEEGADWVPYLSGASSPGGYADVISPATRQPIAEGDILMLDTGLVLDGYFCDFDRNYSAGPARPEAAAGYAQLIEATDAGFEAAQPGACAADLYHAMRNIISGGENAAPGRFGHGLGLQLTEWPSLVPDDHTILEPGMVLALEPSVEVSSGCMIVHEENIVIRENGAEYLSKPASRSLPEIGRQ